MFSPLDQYSVAAWADARESLLPSIHAVDRDAVRIWCQFHPLPLADAFTASNDREQLPRQLRITGEHDLKTLCDTSHWFLYGHRFWPRLKQVVLAWLDHPHSTTGGLAAITKGLAGEVAAGESVGSDLTLGITFV